MFCKWRIFDFMDIRLRMLGFRYLFKFSFRVFGVGCLAWVSRSEGGGGGIEFLVVVSINLVDSWCWLFWMVVF